MAVVVAGCATLGSAPAASGSGRPAAEQARANSSGGWHAPRPSPSATAAGSPSASAAPSASSASTPYPVGTRQTIVDEPTQTVDIDGNTVERTIPVLVRYPARTGRAGQDNAGAPPLGGQFPLVIFAPGYLQCGSRYAPLLRSWASAGFVVAELTFPLTNCHVADPDESDILNQPYDVRAVITQLLADSADPGSPFYAMISPARIAVAGHSDGGDTAAAVAFNTCCRDSRVKAALILAGAELSSFGGTYFPPGSPPALFVQGDDDPVNVPADTRQLYDGDQAGPKALLTLPGAGHYTPYEGDGATEQLVARVTTDFLRMTLLGSDAAGQAMVRDGNVPGRAVLTTSGM
jgi:predicted dienelactone hydrolase